MVSKLTTMQQQTEAVYAHLNCCLLLPELSAYTCRFLKLEVRRNLILIYDESTKRKRVHCYWGSILYVRHVLSKHRWRYSTSITVYEICDETNRLSRAVELKFAPHNPVSTRSDKAKYAYDLSRVMVKQLGVKYKDRCDFIYIGDYRRDAYLFSMSPGTLVNDKGYLAHLWNKVHIL